jgi:hypothetical protein
MIFSGDSASPRNVAEGGNQSLWREALSVGVEVISDGFSRGRAHQSDTVETSTEPAILRIVFLLANVQFLKYVLESNDSVGILLDDVGLCLLDIVTHTPHMQTLSISSYQPHLIIINHTISIFS